MSLPTVPTWIRSAAPSAIVLVAAFLFPGVATNGYEIYVATLVAVYFVVGLGLDVVFGFAGQISIGAAGFYAIGGYTAVLLARAGQNLIVVLVVALLAGLVVGTLLGMVAMQLRGFGFAIVTYGFAVVIQTIIVAAPKVTGGVLGLSVPAPKLFGAVLSSPTALYYVCAVCLVPFVIANVVVRNSYVGRSLLAIQASEPMARSVGLAPARYRVAALAYSGASASIGGALFVLSSQYIASPAFDPALSVTFFAMVVIGGVRSNIGVLCGAFVVVWLPSVLQATSELSYIIFGVALVLALMVSERGVVGLLSTLARRLVRQLTGRRGPPPPVAARADGDPAPQPVRADLS